MKAFYTKRISHLALAIGVLLIGSVAAEAQTRGTSSSSRSSSASRGTTSSRGTTQNRTTSTQGRSGGGGGNYGTTRQYPNATMVGDAIITADAETRRLIVITDDDTNEQIKAVIASLDQPKPQVLINVVFLQVTHGNDLDVGVDAHYKRAGVDDGKGIVQTLFGGSALTSGAFYRLAHSNIDATINALSTFGKTEILSRPSILARSSQQAIITVGQEVPFITNSRVTDTGQTVNTVQYQDIGIILRVTPYITQDGMVEMIVSPEISSVSDRTVAVSDTVRTPLIDKRSADTVVVTPDSKTVVIGGLISTTTTDSDSKVPILGDIPLVGMAFKRKIKSDIKQELLIFMTPHVVKRPTDLVQLSGEEQGKLEMAPKTFDKKDINKYLGNGEQKP